MKLTQEHIDNLFNSATLFDMQVGPKSTLVSATFPNGFQITETSACIDPENYDHELGKEQCVNRIKSKLWELEGYVAHGRNGFAHLATDGPSLDKIIFNPPYGFLDRHKIVDDISKTTPASRGEGVRDAFVYDDNTLEMLKRMPGQ